jgi:O-acetyl-ADP-ribose deacetylase (regulator of RNase III)
VITYSRGDLLSANTEALVNAVNCVGVMGKGIAAQFKRVCPRMFTAYQEACMRGDMVIGRVLVYDRGNAGGVRYIINFPTKDHWRDVSRLAYIDAGLVDLVRVVRELGIHSIALPALGTGAGGLAWTDVEPRMVSAFQELIDVRVVIYEPV